MAVQKGTNIVWGTGVTGISGFTAAVSSGYTITGDDFAKEADKEEIRDGNGEIKTVYWYNGRQTVSIKCFPSGASADAASLPNIAEVISVASNDNDVHGNWLCDSVSRARKQDGIVEFDLGLISYDGITV